ncbi:MAG: hypothetical protein SV686_03860 [Thermodesulfobacteriota bacterium]|jgi:hypothetical protein|nr:hypothetical protein [Thermodesulfobacteriota bacterium]
MKDKKSLNQIAGRFELDIVYVFGSNAGSIVEWLAGYRRRMVHFCKEVFANELSEICSSQLSGVIYVSDAIKRWINGHPELIDTTL